MEEIPALKYASGNSLQILDSLMIPKEVKYEQILGTEDCFHAIKERKVRGAPLEAVVAALSIVLEIRNEENQSVEELQNCIKEKLNYLSSACTTTVNMKNVFDRIKRTSQKLAQERLPFHSYKKRIIEMIENLKVEDETNNKRLAEIGADEILSATQESQVVVTHTNTGVLSTCGYGTALGLIRTLHRRSKLKHVFCTETRPLNHGSRLTTFELMKDEIPVTLITESAGSAVMLQKQITAVIVGANAIAANGDTASEIGTYQLAISAKYHNIPFYVCATTDTIDLSLKTGQDIEMELRPAAEVTFILNKQIAPEEINVWNPSYDITPAGLITRIVTENGVYLPGEIEKAVLLSEEGFFVG